MKRSHSSSSAMKNGEKSEGKDAKEIKEEPNSTGKNRKLNTSYDERSTNCPYLYTINRKALDFDAAKICSVTMSKNDVYCCLVDGQYFKGRGQKSPAYFHALNTGHYLYMNVENGQVFCLPDNYEVHDSTLNDIKDALLPVFLPSDILSLESRSLQEQVTFHGDTYIPGYMVLNNLGCTDSINCVVQILSILSPLRNRFLLLSNATDGDNTLLDNDISKNKKKLMKKEMKDRPGLLYAFSDILKRIWSLRNPKAIISPHTLVEQISNHSKGRFKIGKAVDIIQLLTWTLNELHVGLGGKPNKTKSSVIFQALRGEVKIRSERIEYIQIQKSKEENNENDHQEIDLDEDDEDVEDENKAIEDALLALQKEELEEKNASGIEQKFVDETVTRPFLFLSLDLPEKRVYKNMRTKRKDVIESSLDDLLLKYNGQNWTVGKNKTRMQYRITMLPEYLIFHLPRF